MDMRKQILDKEDTIEAGACVTAGQLWESPLIQKEAPALAQALRGDLKSGRTAADMEIRQVLFQDIACPCRHSGSAPCIKDGGSLCHGVLGENQRLSVMGGKSAALPACQKACPLNLPVPEILELLRSGNTLEAQRTLMKFLPMAEMICPSCTRCQACCVRTSPDGQVKAHKVMEWLGTDIRNHPEIFFIKPSGDSGKWIAMEEVTLSGLSAAYYLRRMGSHVIFLRTASAKELLSRYEEALAEAMEGPLKAYMDNLRYMGVIFGKDDAGEETVPPVFDLEKTWEDPVSQLAEGEPGGLKELAEAVRIGAEQANEVNLSYGLKSYLEPGKTFGGFDREGIKAPSPDWMENTLAAAKAEAARCLHCGCFGAWDSRIGGVLFMTETQIRTTQRMIRAQDYFSSLNPWEQLKPGEEILSFSIPKSGDFISGSLADGELSLAYAFFVSSKKLMDARLTFCGIAPVPVRLVEAEKFLRRKEIASLTPESAAQQIMAVLISQAVLMSGSEEKLRRVQNLLEQALTNL